MITPIFNIILILAIESVNTLQVGCVFRSVISWLGCLDHSHWVTKPHYLLMMIIMMRINVMSIFVLIIMMMIPWISLHSHSLFLFLFHFFLFPSLPIAFIIIFLLLLVLTCLAFLFVSMIKHIFEKAGEGSPKDKKGRSIIKGSQKKRFDRKYKEEKDVLNTKVWGFICCLFSFHSSFVGPCQVACPFHFILAAGSTEVMTNQVSPRFDFTKVVLVERETMNEFCACDVRVHSTTKVIHILTYFFTF